MTQAPLLTQLHRATAGILILSAFVIPVLFLPFTPEWHEFNKQVVLVSVTLLTLVLWTLYLALTGGVRILKTRANLPLFTLIGATLLAFLFGEGMYGSLTSMTTWTFIAIPLFYLVTTNTLRTPGQLKAAAGGLIAAGIVTSVATLVLQGSALGMIPLPFTVPEQLKTPTGSLINANILELVTVALLGGAALSLKQAGYRMVALAGMLLALVAFFLQNPLSASQKPLMLSLADSWHISIETIKVNPLFGAGPGNYVESFQRFRTGALNATPEWAVNFGSASSALLQVLTELGLLGFLAIAAFMGMLGFTLYQEILPMFATLMQPRPEKKEHTEGEEAVPESTEAPLLHTGFSAFKVSLLLGVGMAAVLFLIFPLTTTSLFVLALLTALFDRFRFLEHGSPQQEVQIWFASVPVSELEETQQQSVPVEQPPQDEHPWDHQEGSDEEQPKPQPSLIARALPVITHAGFARGLFVGSAALALVGGFGLSRIYAAEVTFAQSLKAAEKKEGTKTYQLQQKAIAWNPYEVKYHVSYANTNMAIANALASKGKENLTPEDGKTIGVLINQAVREARRSVALAPNNSSFWENMGNLYRDLRGVADGADRFAVSAYSQAIVLNPQNPRPRVSLGGLYYGARNYDNALSAFNDAVRLKPDYANAYYNVAWTLRQKGDMVQAAQAMALAVKYTDMSSPDYQKAQNELAELQGLVAKQAQELSQKQADAAQQPQPVLGTQIPPLPQTATPSAQPASGQTTKPAPEEPPSEASPSAEPESKEKE